MFARHLHKVRVVGVAVSTRHLGRERVDDGALGSVIALATMHQMFESCLHGQKFLGLLVQFLDVLKGAGARREHLGVEARGHLRALLPPLLEAAQAIRRLA